MFETDTMAFKCELSNCKATPRRPKSEISPRAPEEFPMTRLRPPPGGYSASRLYKLTNLAELPFDNFEPPPELLKSSRHHIGSKIMMLLKPRKKHCSVATTFNHAQDSFHPSLETFHSQEQITNKKQFPAAYSDHVSKRYTYDADEHIGNFASSTSSDRLDTQNSSSRSSNSSIQSFDSRSLGTPRSPLASCNQLSNSQLMANILISIMDEDDSTSDERASEEDLAPLDGPHESAWHQPLDEILAESPAAARGKQSSGRHIPQGRRSYVTSPGSSLRFGKLDFSKHLDKLW